MDHHSSGKKVKLLWVHRDGAASLLQATHGTQLMQMGGFPQDEYQKSLAVAFMIAQLEMFAKGEATKPDIEAQKAEYLKPFAKAKSKAKAKGKPKAQPKKKEKADDDDEASEETPKPREKKVEPMDDDEKTSVKSDDDSAGEEQADELAGSDDGGASSDIDPYASGRTPMDGCIGDHAKVSLKRPAAAEVAAPESATQPKKAKKDKNAEEIDKTAIAESKRTESIEHILVDKSDDKSKEAGGGQSAATASSPAGTTAAPTSATPAATPATTQAAAPPRASGTPTPAAPEAARRAAPAGIPKLRQIPMSFWD
eukprot:6550670-Pyramimonas_sp.AAC.1